MYPVMLNIEGRKCTIIGGGKVALRKAKKLKEYGGDVTAVASEFCAGFDNINTIQKFYEPSDITNSFLVIAATNDKNLNIKIAQDAKHQNILVSLTDNSELSDFISSCTHTSGDISVSISTSGKFPLLSRKLCEIKSHDLKFYDSILPILEKYRQKIIAENRDTKKELLECLISDDMLEIAKANIEQFENKIKEIL